MMKLDCLGYGNRKMTSKLHSKRQRMRYVTLVGSQQSRTATAGITDPSKTLALLPLFATVSPTDRKLLPELPDPSTSGTDNDPDADFAPFDPSTAFILLSPTKLMTLESRFKRDADAAYVEAKRSMVSSVAQVPIWMYGALAVLGWNEAMAVLFNPLYFAMILILGASA